MNFINIITITIIIIMSTIIIIICTDFCHMRNTLFLTSKKRGPSCLKVGEGELIWVMPESKHSFFVRSSQRLLTAFPGLMFSLRVLNSPNISKEKYLTDRSSPVLAAAWKNISCLRGGHQVCSQLGGIVIGNYFP